MSLFEESLTFDDVSIVPCYSQVETRNDCDTTTRLVGDLKIKIPVISSPMDTVSEWQMIKELNSLGATGVLHRFMFIEQMEENLREIDNSPLIIAIGTKKEHYDNRIRHAYDLGVRIILIDVAHGHSSYVERTIKDIKDKYPDIKIVAGSIATFDAAVDLIKWGADGLRTGIGNGSLCETRIRTGIGVPQVSAIIAVKRVLEMYENKVTLIADGGIRTPGDVSKALALGADSVMLGSLLAGTKEAPGDLIREGEFPDEKLFKIYRGSASQSSKIDRGENDNHIEGSSKKISYKGKVKRIIREIDDGLRSAMSYVGATNLEEFRKNAEFVKVTNAGQIEAKPHLLLKG